MIRDHVACLYDSLEINSAALGELLRSDAPVISDIRSLCMRRPDGIEPGNEVRVLGLSTAADGGGGVFRFHTDDAQDDGGTIFGRRDGKGNWRRVVNTGTLSAEMFGATAESDASASLHALFKAAVDGKHTAILAPNRTYKVSEAIWIVYDGVMLRGNGATLVLNADEIHGSVFNIANCENVTVDDLNIDVSGRHQNGFTICGNTTEFPELKRLGARPVRNVRARGIRVKNARFHVNRREAVLLKSMPVSLAPGQIVDSVDSVGRPVEGTVIAVDSSTLLVDINWRINRAHIGVPLKVRGSGETALIMARKSVDLPEAYSHITFPSWNGKFGGKGISVQRASSEIHIEDFTSTNCDVGLALEAHPPAPQNGMTDVTVEDGRIENARRTALWVHSPAGYTADAMSAKLRNIRIVDPCHTNDRVGVLTFDRAANLTIEDVTIDRKPTGQPVRHALVRGYFTNCSIALSAFDEEAEGVVDYRPHEVFGNAPGLPKTKAGNNSVTVTLRSKWRGGPLLDWHRGGFYPSASRFRFVSAVPGERLACSLPRDPAAVDVDVEIVDAESKSLGGSGRACRPL